MQTQASRTRIRWSRFRRAWTELRLFWMPGRPRLSEPINTDSARNRTIPKSLCVCTGAEHCVQHGAIPIPANDSAVVSSKTQSTEMPNGPFMRSFLDRPPPRFSLYGAPPPPPPPLLPVPEVWACAWGWAWGVDDDHCCWATPEGRWAQVLVGIPRAGVCAGSSPRGPGTQLAGHITCPRFKCPGHV